MPISSPVNPLAQAWDALATAAMQIVPARLPLSPGKADVDAAIADVELIGDKFRALLAAYRDEICDSVPGAERQCFDDAERAVEDAIATIHGHLIELGEQIDADEREREADCGGWSKSARLGVD